MSDTLAAESVRAPYPGLRSFRRDETHLFFGREDCIHSLVDRLATTRFLAVLGSSGTGKSSIVKTGLLEALEIGLMERAGARWRVIDFRPGGAPLTNLARELLKTGSKGEEPSEIDAKMLRGFLARGPRSIIEWCQDGNLPAKPKTNLLLLVDQFEELFRYQGYAGKEESEAFVALLLESANSPEFPIYVTLTMRSEYLGACALIDGLAESISRGMVLIPRMTRAQCRQAIEGPAEVCGIPFQKQDPLVNQILNDLANFAPWDDSGSSDQLDRLVRRADQLPLLQYTLNRMWLDAKTNGQGKPIKLRLADYQAIGGLSGALNTHGNALFDELAKKGLGIVVENIFRALVNGTTVAEAVRRPRTFGDLVALCDGNVQAVEEVLYTFCAPGCNFLAPELRDPGSEKRVPLNAGQWIDISHESLIRQWNKMAEWLNDETIASQNWRRLKDRMADGEQIRGRELANLIAWRDETKPNEAWAARYGGNFKEAMAFLDKSQSAATARRRVFWMAGVVIFGILLASTITAGALWYRAQTLNATLDAQNRDLQNSKELLEKQKTLLESQTKALESQKTALETTLREISEMRKEKVDKTERLAIFGPPPAGNDKSEDEDDKVPATDKISNTLTGPTPKELPGRKTLKTMDLYAALLAASMKVDSTTSVPIVLVDVDSQPHPKTIPTAARISYAGAGGTLDDKIQQKMSADLSKVVSTWNSAIIFFGGDVKSWEGYNAALRAIEIGYPNVYWYRGGLAAWQAQNLKTAP